MPGILDRMACGFALALAIGGRAAAADPLPGGKKTVIFEDCSMCIKHRKYRQKWPLGGVGLGLGGAKAKTAPPGGNWFFGDFLIIFDVAFFSVKIQARAQNIVNTVKKWGSGRVLKVKKCHVFDLVKIWKFKMWKGGGGYPPPLFVLGGFRSQKLSKKNVFLEKTLLGNVVNSSVFACFTFLRWKMWSLNLSLFTMFYACVF